MLRNMIASTVAALSIIVMLFTLGCTGESTVSSAPESGSEAISSPSVSSQDPPASTASTASTSSTASEKAQSPTALSSPSPSSQSSSASTASHSSAEAKSSDAASGETSAKPKVDDKLVRDFKAIAKESGMKVGVVAIDLVNGTEACFQESKRMISASMIKLVIAAAFLEKVHEKSMKLNAHYTIKESDIVGGTGSLGGLGAGADVTYKTVLEKMISESDNTATNILIDEVGMDAINAEAHKLGLTSTKLNRHMMDDDAIAAGIENYTSAADIATVLEKVYKGTLVDAKLSAIVMDALRDQKDTNGILEGLPSGTSFAHKTGALGSVRHDGGIVEGKHPYVLVVLCGGTGFNEQGAFSAMADIAKASYNRIVK